MGKTEYIERPKDGDYCKPCQAIIYDENGEIMCDKCVKDVSTQELRNKKTIL